MFQLYITYTCIHTLKLYKFELFLFDNGINTITACCGSFVYPGTNLASSDLDMLFLFFINCKLLAVVKDPLSLIGRGMLFTTLSWGLRFSGKYGWTRVNECIAIFFWFDVIDVQSWVSRIQVLCYPRWVMLSVYSISNSSYDIYVICTLFLDFFGLFENREIIKAIKLTGVKFLNYIEGLHGKRNTKRWSFRSSRII